MNHPITAGLLGIVEGLTEFLPVSSTGHLILATEIFGYDPDQWAQFNVVIQLGAILAVVVLYWKTFMDVLQGLFRRDADAMHFVRNLLIAFVPAAILGLALHKKIEALLGNPQAVCVAFILGGVAILIIERFTHEDEPEGIGRIPLRQAVLIGCAQCLAMFPGVSRSGATIMGARAMGVRKKTAAEFSFFLAIPTMLGATVVELLGKHHAAGLPPSDVGMGEIAIGFVVAFVVALAVIKAFVGYITKHGFAPFAWYRIAAGIVGLIWLRMI